MSHTTTFGHRLMTFVTSDVQFQFVNSTNI